MKKFIAVLAMLMMTLLACDSSTISVTDTGAMLHWQQTSTSLERRIDVVVPAEFATSGFMWGMGQGIAQVNRSPYIEMRLVVETTRPTSCPDRHCIVVIRQAGTTGDTYLGYRSDGILHGQAAVIVFDSAPWRTAVFVNAACHELFHAVGLGHSTDGTPGPCQNGVATATDLANVARSHNRRDPSIYG